MKHADVIAKLSLREKCALLSGATVFETHALPNKGVPAIWLSDGPNGLRKQAGPADHLGLNPAEPATCYRGQQLGPRPGRGDRQSAGRGDRFLPRQCDPGPRPEHQAQPAVRPRF